MGAMRVRGGQSPASVAVKCLKWIGVAAVSALRRERVYEIQILPSIRTCFLTDPTRTDWANTKFKLLAP